MTYVKDDIVHMDDEQKITLLRRALKILGPKGENWMKGTWFGIRRHLIDGRPDPADYDHVNPEDADTYCLLGALEEASFQLGYTSERETSGRLGWATSVAALATTRKRPNGLGAYSGVMGFNDAAPTTFSDVKTLVEERIAELEGASS